MQNIQANTVSNSANCGMSPVNNVCNNGEINKKIEATAVEGVQVSISKEAEELAVLVRSREFYRQEASAGNSIAQYNYAKMCSEGIGGEVDFPEARIHYQSAAQQGLKEAQNKYANLLYSGKGGEVDLVEARNNYRLAADQGLAESQFHYAVMNYLGEGGEADEEVASKYFKLAAEQGFEPAKHFHNELVRLGLDKRVEPWSVE